MQSQVTNYTKTEKYMTHPYPCDRTSTPKLKRKNPSQNGDKQYEKFYIHLIEPAVPQKLSLKGSLNSKTDLISGHLVFNVKNKDLNGNIFSARRIKITQNVDLYEENITMDVQFLEELKNLPEEEVKKQAKFARMLRKMLVESKLKWLRNVGFLRKKKMENFGTYGQNIEVY
ncbi:unnamed protein product [Psylliodes chrysocephalus]|uniref:Uncharacterized protein n=1 Tax=Psylliodes chrysocephalus TaxID=3402493 RepID=A0A9P0CD44_9CUCU|nr:unnamed protein product [Psylliodes chrysocephala]